jgi:AcrR family transcriptional regulator
MYHIKNDQRAIRSTQMLYDGLARLIREKPFNTITVTDPVESAQVGRTTFYRNFDEIEDILRMSCDQTIDELITYVMGYPQQNPNETHVEHIHKSNEWRKGALFQTP